MLWLILIGVLIEVAHPVNERIFDQLGARWRFSATMKRVYSARVDLVRVYPVQVYLAVAAALSLNSIQGLMPAGAQAGVADRVIGSVESGRSSSSKALSLPSTARAAYPLPESIPQQIARRRPRATDEIYPPSPLENADPDPWYPDPSVPLSPSDRQTLLTRLEGLNMEATALLTAGQTQAAFDLWNRELRLRRGLGVDEELTALVRVGAIAWEQKEFYEMQVIARRARAIQTDLLGDPLDRGDDLDRPEPSLTTLRLLADTYAAVQLREPAVEMYEYALTDANQRGDRLAAEETLRIIGDLNYGDLNFEDAVADYEELVDLATARGDALSLEFYLERLAFMYDQLERPTEAIPVKQKLITHYQTLLDIPRVTALHIAIGNDYRSLGEVESAIDHYQQAYAIAWEASQFYRAGEAITQLAALLEAQQRDEEALNVYRIAIDINTISNDRYGLMTTYDKIAQVYQRRNAYRQALDAYQRGLEVAQQINGRTAYFQAQIDYISRLLQR